MRQRRWSLPMASGITSKQGIELQMLQIFETVNFFLSFPKQTKHDEYSQTKNRPTFAQELFPLLRVPNPARLTEQQRWTGRMPLLQDVLCYQVSSAQLSLIVTNFHIHVI